MSNIEKRLINYFLGTARLERKRIYLKCRHMQDYMEWHLSHRDKKSAKCIMLLRETL